MRERVIPILRVDDAEVAVGWYGRLGFVKDREHRFEPRLPAFVAISRGEVELFLSEHTGDASPDTLIYLWVDDVDAVAAEFNARITEQPWGRELEIRDADGNRLRIATPSTPAGMIDMPRNIGTVSTYLDVV
jgi:glyoxalase superfamily protein